MIFFNLFLFILYQINCKAELLFNDIRNSLNRIIEKLTTGSVSNNSKSPSSGDVFQLEALLNMEKENFEVGTVCFIL